MVAMRAEPSPPTKNATLRRTGQRSPRRRSTISPAAYSTPGTAMPSAIHQSELHSVSSRIGGQWRRLVLRGGVQRQHDRTQG